VQRRLGRDLSPTERAQAQNCPASKHSDAHARDYSRGR
jgi:hypothetical protein